MRAAVLHGTHDLRFEEVPDPLPRPDEAVVRISANGICGSDIHFFDQGKLGPFVVDRPYIPGHEASGVILEEARDGSGPKRGTRVSIEPGIPCRRCALCKSGRYNLCKDVVFMSAPPVNGTFAELTAVAADFLHPLPDQVDDESGAFVEPISVALQACTRARLEAGQSIAILGAGPIGLVTMLVAHAFGAAKVYLIDVLDNRLSVASSLGASAVVNANDVDVRAEIDRLTEGNGAATVFDTSGSSKACALAPLLAARGGTVVLVGWPERGDFSWPIEVAIEKELDVVGVNRYCNTYPRAIALLQAGLVDVAPLVTHRFPFEKVCDAFSFALSNRAATIKVMVGRSSLV
jgi:L-iditol 2-dehydrogenase